MIWLRSHIGKLFRDERGASAVEYALLAAVIGFGLVLTLSAFQSTLYNVYVQGIANTLANYTGG